MNKKLKAKWVKALRSGKYKQGRGQLYNPKTKRYCCLGVLCRLGGRDDEFLMSRRCETHGLLDANLYPDDESAQQLAFMNDGLDENNAKIHRMPVTKRHTFRQIADYIEENL